LAAVVGEFVDELGRQPTLGELLEIVALSVPSAGPVGEGLPTPLVLRAKVSGRRAYRSSRRSEVSELNDAVFAVCGAVLAELLEGLAASVGRAPRPKEFAAAVLEALREPGLLLEDIRAEEVVALTASGPKLGPRPARGDVVAVPLDGGGFRLAVVIAHNQFGTAFGFFEGVSPLGRLEDVRRDRAQARHIYSDDLCIRQGVWSVVGHDESLVEAFPPSLERFYRPGDLTGPFGAAETPEGRLRDLTEAEAKQIGVLQPGFDPAPLCEKLQRILSQQNAT